MIKYSITDPKFYNYKYLKNLNNRVDFLLLRDKTTTKYKYLAKEFLNNTKKFTYKKIIHQDYNLAKELNADGVHLTSTQFSDIPKAKELDLLTIISTHSIKEIEKANQLGADIVTFSPIFATPNKGEPKGVKLLKEAVDCCNIKVIALGGIVTEKDIASVEQTGAHGFASIRYFL